MIKIQLFLDNNAVNKFYNDSIQWKDTKLAKTLLKHKEKVEVFATPDNVIEIALCPDINKRNIMAIALSNLIDGRRMLPTWEWYFSLKSCELINMHWNNSIENIDIIKRISEQNALIYAGLLSQLAAIKNYQINDYENLIKPKFISAFIQSCFVNSPDEKIDLLLSQISNRDEKIDERFQEEITQAKLLTVVDLKEKIKQNLGESKRKVNLNKLEKNKERLIDIYSIHHAKNAFFNTFLSPIYKTFIIDYEQIAKNWDEKFPLIEKGNNVDLGKEIYNFFVNKTEPKFQKEFYYFLLIDKIIMRHYKTGLFPSINLMVTIFFNELIRTIKSPEKISYGTIFDMNYAIILISGGIFLTFDDKLAETMRVVANNLSSTSDEDLKFKILTSTEHLDRYLEKL